MVSPTRGFATSKAVEKAVFAAGLSTLGAVVRAWLSRVDAQNAEAIRRLRAEWGKPVSIAVLPRGFVRIRIEEYRRGSRRAIARFRNERLEHVDVLP
jgi:hypothetical protein